MSPQQYQQIRQLFDAVQAEPSPERREALLTEAPDLRAAVERLLEAAARGTGVFEQPSVVAFNSSSASEPGWEGRRLGPYELLSELGEGGMGVVYLARRADGAFEKQVAIKIVRQNLATPEFLARFQREREILAKLEHPHIARLLDGGATPQGLAYLVMEYVKGESLLAYADSRRLTYDNRLRLLRQVAEAVDYAHEQGVIHRDLKPSNIFVGLDDGQVKLLDFGIAAWQSGASDLEAAAPTIALSPAYASPEQARGERTTKASDIYSLAMVAYELLAGTLPFEIQGARLPDILQSIAEGTPKRASDAILGSPKRALLARKRRVAPVDWITRVLETADRPLAQALSKRPQDRQQSAQQIILQLESQSKPQDTSPWARFSETMRQQTPLLVGLTAFGMLAASGEIVLQPLAWGVSAAAALLLALRNSAWVRQFFLNPYLWSLILFGGGPMVWVFAHRGGKSGFDAMMILICLFVAASVVSYLLRSIPLQTLTLRSRAPVGGVKMALAAICAVGFAMQIATNDNRSGIFTPLPMLIMTAFPMLPFEIRRGGIVASGTILKWQEVESYFWLNGTVLQFKLRSKARLSLQSELPVEVRYEDIEAIQAELQQWLREEPSPRRPLALGDFPEQG